MSLSERVNDLATRVAQEIKALRSEKVAKNGDSMTGNLLLSGGFAGLWQPQNSSPDQDIVPSVNNLSQDPFSSLWHDLFAFGRHTGLPKEEVSADGSTWTEVPVHRDLFTQKENQTIPIADGTTNRLARWTWESAALAYSQIRWIVVGFSYEAVPSTRQVLVESSSDGVNWTQRHLSADGSWNAQPVWFAVSENPPEHEKLRVTIGLAAGAPASTTRLSAIRGLSSRWGDQGGGSELEVPYNWDSYRTVTFERAKSAQSPVDGDDLARKDYVDGRMDGKADSVHTHSSSQISDSTAIGRSVLTAADAATARTAIGAGTSSLVIGTTSSTAKAGDYSPPADAAAGTASLRTLGTGANQAAAGNDARLSDARTPTAHTHTSDQISDATSASTANTIVRRDASGNVGVNRVALNAAPSSASDATRKDYVDGRVDSKADSVHTHTASQVSDATTTGRSVMTAASAAAARTAIGAGTSSLTIGTTASTAKAGNYAPPSSSDTVQGVVELATTAEATTGTDTVRAVTPAGVKAVADTKAALSFSEAVVIHDGSTGGGTRPSGYARVRWVNPPGTSYSRPTNMVAGDAWSHPA